MDDYQVFKTTQWKSSFLQVSKLVSEYLLPFSEDTEILKFSFHHKKKKKEKKKAYFSLSLFFNTFPTGNMRYIFSTVLQWFLNSSFLIS